MKKTFFIFVLAFIANLTQAQTQAQTQTNTSNRPAKVKAGKYASPPMFIAPAVTNASASKQVFDYTQVVTNRYGTGPGEVQPQAPGSIQWSTPQAAPAQSYSVDQRPLDQGAQPAPVAHYATHQATYATAPATYAVQSAYPVYAELGSYYPVAHYATYGYSYPTYGYGVGYISPRRLFGVSFDAVVSPAYSYSPGWVVRGDHHHSHQQNYPTHGDRRGGR